MAIQKEQYETWLTNLIVPANNLYPDAYNFYLITSIDQLKRVLNIGFKTIAFDTETTGLNNDKAMMVGYSFCYDGKNAFYVPVNHAPYIDENGVEKDDSLGEEAVRLFYERLESTMYILTFNQRYDVRVFERYDSIENYTEERYNHKYDMSKFIDKLIDVQALIFDADTNVPYPNLKGSEEKFLGWRGASFKETLGDVENFHYLKPSECYTYAATDALGTYLLGQKFWYYYQDEPAQLTRYPKSKYPNLMHSGELDTKFLYPLMLMEDEFTQVDVDLFQSYSDWYKNQIDKTMKRLEEIRGQAFNPLSSKQKTEAFKDLGIVIYDYDGQIAYNKRGEMKAGKELLQYNMEKLPEGDVRKEFMEGLIKMANLTKQKGTYTDNFVKFCKDNPNGNKLRFGYKTMVVPSGRLAAGGDKKNNYFADSNIQNIPKPKTTMVFYVRYDDLIKVVPELTGMYDNPREEAIYNEEKTYRILDWVFKESPWHLGIKEKKIEGFKQKLNIRSGFMPDDDKYWVSCDFSAQELRVPALLTREPGWCKVFENNGDLHEHMAKVIWGEENYDKQKRKRAKKCNFGILYGMTARNFAIDFDISLDEAQKIVDDYKNGAPVLFNWVHWNEERCINTGVTSTMFGRPRRLGWYLSPDRKSRGMYNFGIRSATNTVIQGTGADILKMSFLNIFNQFFRTKELKLANRKFIKFLNTVHDEINYNVSKQYVRFIIPKIISCMRLWLDDWDFPMQVGLEIGTRWGQTIAFDYDINPFIIPESYQQGVQRYRKMSDEEASKLDIHGLKKYIPDPNGEYINNPNYLSVLEPSGDDVSESDYEVKKEEVVEELPDDVPEEGEFDNLYSVPGFDETMMHDHFKSNINQ